MGKKIQTKKIAGWDTNPSGGRTGKQQVAAGKKISPANKVRIAKATPRKRKRG